MLFYFMHFWCFDILGFAEPGGTAAPKASQFLKIVESHLGAMPCIWKETNLEPCPNSFLWLSQCSHTLDHYSTALNTPGPGTQRLEKALKVLQPDEIIQTGKC